MVPLIATLYLSLSFLITADNLLLICAVHSTRALRKATNFTLVSLAVADLLVGVVVLPLRTVEVLAFQWTRDVEWCRVTLCFTLLSLSASVLNLLSVTAERYSAIMLPLTHNNRFSSRRTHCAIVVVWVAALLVSVWPLLGLDESRSTERSYQHKICRFADTMSTEYLIFFPNMIILIPAVLMSFAYNKIYREACKLRKRLLALQVQSPGEQHVAFLKESKTAKTIGIVIGIFYLCWLPLMIAVVLSAFFTKLVTPSLVIVVSSLVYSNSAMNPVLYGYLNRDFRLAYKRLVPKAFMSCTRIRERRVLKRNGFSLRDRVEGEDNAQGMYSSTTVL